MRVVVLHRFYCTCIRLSLVRPVSPFQLGETCVSPISIPGSNTENYFHISYRRRMPQWPGRGEALVIHHAKVERWQPEFGMMVIRVLVKNE